MERKQIREELCNSWKAGKRETRKMGTEAVILGKSVPSLAQSAPWKDEELS